MSWNGIGGAMIGLAGVGLAACSPGSPPLSGKTVASRCLNMDLPVETAVSLFGVYEGKPGPGERERGFREHRPMRVRVETGAGMGPEVLILSAYQPVVWDVSAVADNDLRGVVAYGYYRPMVVGAPDDLPVRLVALRNEPHDADNMDPVMRPNAADDSGRDDVAGHCGDPAWVHGRGRDLANLSRDVKAGIGLPVTGFVGTYSASSLSLKRPPLPSPADLEKAAAECDTTPEDCFPIEGSFDQIDPAASGEQKQPPPIRTKWRDDPWGRDGG